MKPMLGTRLMWFDRGAEARKLEVPSLFRELHSFGTFAAQFIKYNPRPESYLALPLLTSLFHMVSACSVRNAPASPDNGLDAIFFCIVAAAIGSSESGIPIPLYSWRL